MMQNAGVFDILTCKCACRHSGVPFFHHFSTYERQKVVRTPQFFDILTCKCASRYSGVQFSDIATSKSGPPMRCFVHFDLKMCFSLQQRAIFPHRNFKKWSAHEVFCTFWLENVLLATAACNFSTSQLQKVVRPWGALYILTWKCASRYSGVQFFHIATSKSGPPMRCFVHFDLKMCFSLQRRAIFPHRNFKKWSETVSFLRFWLENVLLATAACHFSYLLSTATSAPAALARLLSHKTLKNTAFRDFSNISRLLIFFLSAPVDLLSCSTAFSTVHIVGS